MAEEEKKDEEEQIVKSTKRQNNTEKFFRWLAVFLAVFGIIALIIIKFTNESFKWSWFIVIVLSVISISLLFYYGFTIYRFYQEHKQKIKEGELPLPITLEQAGEIIEKQLMNPRYANYATNGWRQHKFYNAGKDGKTQVLVVQLEDTPYDKHPFLFYVMNLHYPENKWSLIPQDTYNAREITSAVNYLALSPKDAPDIEESETFDATTGRTHKYKKTTTKKKTESPKVKSTSDLQ